MALIDYSKSMFQSFALIDKNFLEGGFRLVASSLLPLSQDSLKYGSQDAAVTIKKDLPALTQRIEEASAK